MYLLYVIYNKYWYTIIIGIELCDDFIVMYFMRRRTGRAPIII